MKSIHSIDGDLIVDYIAGRPKHKYAWLQYIWLVVLFLGGLYLWGQFLNWGRGPLTIHDWGRIYSPRLTFLREAITRGELPLHMSAPADEGDVTLRFLSIPDQILSPQVLLLPWLKVGQFVLLQFWLMYILGFWALLRLRHRFGLSLLAFTIIFALFNFNGSILAHASVGHANWGGYFLYPIFAILIFDLMDGKAGWGWVAKVAFLSFFILLQGSYHLFIYLLFFLGLLALSDWRHFWLLARTAVFIVLVSMVRLLPAVLLIGKVDNDFQAGYSLLQSIWGYMTQLQIPNDLTVNLGLTRTVGTWEYTFFIGIPATLFILYFGVLRSLTDGEDPYHFRLLLLPCLGLTLLSLDRAFLMMRTVIPIPLFTSERVAARIFGLAFVFILIMATVQFQRWLDKRRLPLIGCIAILLLVVMVANDLQRNLFLWSLPNVAQYYPVIEWEPKLYFPLNLYTDTPYLWLLVIGLLVSLLSALALIYLAWRERRVSRITPQHG